MNRSLICYHGGWFAELDWLRRLLDWPTADCVIDETQSLVVDNSIVLCANLAGMRPELLARIRQTKGVVLFHISDEWYRQPVQVYANFAHVIRNYHYECLRHPAITTLPLGPCRDVRAKQAARPLSQRSNVWSFAGQLTSTRLEMVEALSSVDPGFQHVTSHDGVKLPSLDAASYRDLLCESIFVPCPMGNVNLESFRLYEALDAGAIPIVERRPWLDYYTRLLGPHPLLVVNHWHEAPERMKSLMDDVAALDRRQREISEWWHRFEVGLKQRLAGVLEACLDSTAKPLAGMKLPTRGQGFWEMLKHHNGVALSRRLGAMARRMLR
jgi:hypothetical protein